MLDNMYESLMKQSTTAVVIVGIAIMLSVGFLMTRITKKLRLPNVTAYILAGILIGPFCLNLVPDIVIKGSAFLADIALAFISFSTAQFFKFDKLKNNAGKVVIITMLESLLATFFVFILTYWVLHLNLAFSIVLSALASATAPASTMMTIRQTKSKGEFVDTLLQVVAYDDIVALVAYSIAISIAVTSISGKAIVFMDILIPILKNIGVIVLGGLFGVLMKLLIEHRKSSDNRLIIALAILFSFCGICAGLSVSPLLGCMAMGTVYINLTNDDNIFKQLNYFNPPFLLLFFVRSGCSFDLNALFSQNGALGATPLIVIGVSYFFIRIVGKYVGSFVGCLITKKPARVRNYLGMALIPQAGVAIGLASLGARTLGGEMGTTLETVILASSVLYELIGPLCAKASLYLSKSYSNKIEEIVPLKEEEVKVDPVELLIKRINVIQEEIKNEDKLSEEERAFTDAANDTLNELYIGGK